MEMKKAEKTPSHPTHSTFLFTPLIAYGADFLKILPTANSAISKGMPTVNKATKYGIRKAPPPFLYAT